jgi:hypothetical protein
VPASAYFEWTGANGDKQPWYFTRADGQLLAFTGLWHRWKDRASGDPKHEDKQNPGLTDEEKKLEDERAGQNPYDMDQASNPERQKKQDPQFDPSHIQEDPTLESTR